MKKAQATSSVQNQEENHLKLQLSQALEQIEYLKTHDETTNLLNFTHFKKQIHQINQSTTGQLHATVFIHLNNFKSMDELFGHTLSQIVIQHVVQRITLYLQKNDLFARKERDEFAIYLTNVSSIQHVKTWMETIIKTLTMPFHIEQQCIYLIMHMGVSLYPQHSASVDTLMTYTSTACHQARLIGSNNYQFFMQSMAHDAEHMTALERQLYSALARDEFFLCYQPQIDIATREVVGMEALLRWNNQDIGHITPQEFIPLAEKNGLIFPISDWVLKQACHQMVDWTHHKHKLQLAINLSTKDFQAQSPTLIERIQLLLQITHIEPTQLELEITESSIMNNYTTAIPVMHALRDLGIRIACDDFGAGYSSLNYLKQLPIDTLKIDKSFIDDMTWNVNDMAIIRAILSIAEHLGIRVIAEGVENALQVDMLRDLGCSIVQGFYFSRPLSSFEATHLLQSTRK